MMECSGRVLDSRPRGRGFRASLASLGCGPWARHIYPSLVTQEDPSLFNWKIVDGTNQIKQANKTRRQFLIFQHNLILQAHTQGTVLQPQAVVPPQPMVPASTGAVVPTQEMLAKLKSELDVVQGNVRVMSEMLTELTPSDVDSSDLELLQVSIGPELSEIF